MSENGHRPDLPEGWEWQTMGDVARVVGGSTPKSKEPSYWDGPIPWLGVADLTDYEEMYIDRGSRSITQAGYESCATQMLPKGTVLFSSRAPIGYVAIAATDLCTSQGFKSFVPSDVVTSEYLYWWLKYARPIVEAMASGTTFKEISGRRAAEIPVPVPPVAEQRRLVARAAELDRALLRGAEALWAAQENRQRLIKAFYRDLGFSGDSLEVGWEVRRLRDVADCKLGKMLDKVKNEGEPRPYLRNINVQWGRFDLADLKSMRIKDEEVDRFRVRPGDLLMCEGGEPGRFAIWERDEEIYFQKALHRVRPREGVSAEFLQRFFSFAADAGYLARHFTGTTIKHLPGEKLAAIEVPIPPPAQQARLMARADEFEASLDELDASIASALNERERLMRAGLRDLFAGL